MNSQPFHEVNVTPPFRDNVWKDFWYRANKLGYCDRDALLTIPWPPYKKRVLLITIRMNLNGNEDDEQEISRSCRSMRGSIHGGSISNCSEPRTQIIKPHHKACTN